MNAWMIERPDPANGRATWWTGLTWSTDPNVGIRFARREDAERLLAACASKDFLEPRGVRGWRYTGEPVATDHGWDP